MKYNAKTVSEYLEALPEDRRAAINAVRKVILQHLPKGYEEILQYGMIGYAVPLKLYPPGYHCRKNEPLPYAALASQKNFMSVYLCNIYGDKKTEQWFRKEYQASGKKLDMGKSCIRFKKLEDLPLELIGKAIARTSVKNLIKMYEQARPASS
jgi:hypothetical protein